MVAASAAVYATLKTFAGRLLRHVPEAGAVEVPLPSASHPTRWALKMAGRDDVQVLEVDGAQSHFEPTRNRIVIGRAFKGDNLLRIHAALHEASHALSPRWRTVLAGAWWLPRLGAAVFGLMHSFPLSVALVALGVLVRLGVALPEEIGADRGARRWIGAYLSSLGVDAAITSRCEAWADSLAGKDMRVHVLNALSEVVFLVFIVAGAWSLR